MTPERCEPPPELRDVDGWHWVKCGDDDPEVVRWQHDGGGIWCMGTGSPRPAYAYSLGWRYLAPVSTPAEVDALRADLERERMRLAACGVVALSDTPESAARERNMHPDYRSASCDDVARRVDECMSLRARVATLEEALRDARLQLEYMDERSPSGTTPTILARISAALSAETP